MLKCVVGALKHFDGSRYKLHAWCVMPNHVHVVFTVEKNSEVADRDGVRYSELIPILHSWKSFTAHEANKILQTYGKFWQDEYYDHLIRNDDDFAHSIEYTLNNPVKAGFCKLWKEWLWSGCSQKVSDLLEE
ncbi:MAG: hypothetical protein C5B54_12195 [Acidobacteria bacterium]|nr:MAG: hypothetical protein C5B54_12195 [Acidobacteriota bacterium]